ncbi:glycosyltransferase [Actinomyces sp. zg-332]|uniref:glycosyltransferase n=1 Tax=Actinomyces sp. zg-332 TaxID=2708340 RepID=UPI001421DF4F|nr:glycosyltransferase [Actinomyces sp. zg-332]QPK94075.1 glycosyltransferase [Actinomyces sp. zg-332]
MVEKDNMYPGVAVIIPAKDEETRVASTIRACRGIPNVDLIIVVDDGSVDDTQHVARAAGAVVVRHSVNRGKAAAMETGSKVAFMRDYPETPGRLLLFIDADLGESAVECIPIVEAVQTGKIDCGIAVFPPQKDAGGHGIVTGFARKAIYRATGWSPRQPLSGQRCLTKKAMQAAMPLASDWGVETGMTIDLLVKGYTLQEIPCNLTHRVTKNDFSGYLHRAKQYKGVWLAVMIRRLKGVKANYHDYIKNSRVQEFSKPYKARES